MEPNQPNNKRKRKSPKQCTILKIKNYRKRDQPYTRILNETLRDQRLGGMARAILAYALSRPSDWKLHSWEVAKEFQCGKFAVRTAMKQLKDAGYARIDLVRTPSGTVEGQEWLIRESPELEWPSPRRGFSTLGYQQGRAAPPSPRPAPYKNE
jgi:hypothetical protein